MVIARRFPTVVRKFIRRQNVSKLPQGYPVDVDFNPATTRGTSACAWWPTATCSRRSARGNLDVITDHIDHFDATGGAEVR